MQLKQQSEPCVRITVSIPKDAAQRLRHLAAEGSSALRALGILGVQLEGDSVISLKLAGQDVNVNTADNASGGLETAPRSTSHVGQDVGRLDELSQLLGNGATAGNNNAYFQQHVRVSAGSNVVLQQQQQKQQEMLQHQRRNILLGGPSTSSAAQQALLQRQQQGLSGYSAVGSTPQVFKSPNTICPMEGKVPLPPQVLNPTTGTVPSNARDFPFESMRQARVLQGRGQEGNIALNTNIANGPVTASGVVPIQPSLASSLSSPVHGKGSQPHQLGQTLQPQLMSGSVVAPPNVALKVVKNPQSGEIVTTIAAGATATLGGKTQFLQPPPPPYPGVGVGINATHNNSAGTIANQQVVNKAIHQTQQYLPSNATAGPATSSNNIAISSPLLVNLLQNDGNSSTSIVNQSSQQSKPLTPTQTLLHQQQSPLASMSPSAQQQQHLVNSPMRDFLIQQPQQTTSVADASNLGAIGVPSSPSAAGVSVNPNSNRNMQPQQQQITQSQGQQQLLLSPNNMYNQQQPRFHQQQVTPQQVALLRHQQIQRQQQMQQQNSGGASPQRFIQQQTQVVSPALNQMRQIRPTMNLQHQQHQQPYMNSGGISPVAHSPASSHHSSLHSPLAMPTPQQLLSPSTTPAQSPHHHPHTHTIHPQQSLQTQQVLANPMTSQVPPANNTILPPPPDYNQAAAASASARWPALNKPMDSATKSSYQEFTRYQMQYNLQQQQISSNQQLHPHQQGQNQQTMVSASGQETASTISNVNTCNPNMPDVSSLGETNTAASNNLPDALMELSDLDGLTPNDLDALLPSLSCDLDSTLSLEDKNELESLLQDAKDLDLDLIEENLSAVGVDIGDAATATSLIEDEIVASTSSLQTGIEQNLSLSLMQQQNLITSNISNTNMQQQQSQQQQFYLQQQVTQVSQIPVPNQHHLMQNSSFVSQQQNQFSNNSSNGTSTFMRSASAASTSSTISATTTQKQLIINPLTGELEPMPSDDSETEAEQETQHLIRPPSVVPSSRTTPASSIFSSGSYIPAASESLPNILFSAEEDSNSCSTAVSKVSEHNNGLIGTSGAGSDTDRSRDSFISNKSTGRSRKGAGKMNQQQQLCNKLGTSADALPSSMTPRSSNSSPLIVGGVTAMGINSNQATANRKSKPNLLREKLQQGVRERKKENTVAKPKRERNKTGGKTKVSATMASGINHSGVQPIATVASIAETSATNEKIKLRLKIEKSEPVSPAYKVDVKFVPSPKTTIGEIMTSHSSTLESNSAVSSTAPTTAMTLVGSTNPSIGMNSLLQNQLNSQMLATNTLQHQQHQQQQPQNHLHTQQSVQNFNNFNLPSAVTMTATSTSTSTTSPLSTGISGVSGAVDEPKVPPLHISLRGGKNSIVIKNSRKDRKKSQVTSIPGDVDDDTKTKQLKRTLHVSATTANSVDSSVSSSTIMEDISGASDAKQSKLQHSGAIITQYNGTLESGNKSNSISENLGNHFISTAQIASNAAVSKTTTLLANKNGLTISALSAISASDIDNKGVSNSGTTLSTSSVSSATISTSTSLSATTMSALPHLLKHQQQQQAPQIIKTAALPSSITLSTVSCSSTGGATTPNSSVAHRVIANLHLKNALKTSSATITPIVAGGASAGGFSGGKPLTKSHKPPSYLAAVQQLQLQKQQQQQMAALAEKQTQQQMLAAAAQILPSATTLKRVEINTLTNKIESHEVIAPVSVATILNAVKSQSEAGEQLPKSSGVKTEICDKNKQSILTSIAIVSATMTTTTTPASATSTATPTKTGIGTTSNIVNQSSLAVTKDTSISIIEKNTGKTVLVKSVSATVPSSSLQPVSSVATTTTATPSPPSVLSAAIVTSPILRNSPASNGNSHLGQGNNNNGSTGGGGEDSGIESMDALSEKSPHQQASSSPAQQPQVISTPTVQPVQPTDAPSGVNSIRSNASNANEKYEKSPKSILCPAKHTLPDQQTILVADDEIEKALAKMEGLQEDNSSNAPTSLSPGNTKTTELKVNGEHFTNTNSLNVTSLDDEDNDDLIKNLTEGVEISKTVSTSVNKNEDKSEETAKLAMVVKDIKEVINVKKEEPQVIDAISEEKPFHQDTFSKLIKDENRKCEIAQTSKLSSSLSIEKVEEVEVIKLEMAEDVNKDLECEELLNKEALKDSSKTQQDVLTPISIDIPVSTDSEPRIRTRASSRLESPLEQVRTDISPFSENTPTLSADFGITVNKQVNPRGPSPQSNILLNNSQTSSPSTANGNLSATSTNKDPKRKRADVDSSESLDLKRVRTANVVTTSSQMSENVLKNSITNEVTLGDCTTTVSAHGSLSVEEKSSSNSDVSKITTIADAIQEGKPQKKIEESSDSDEPLIEVAEKVRNSKAATPILPNSVAGVESESNVTSTATSTGLTSKSAISKETIENKDNSVALNVSNLNSKTSTPNAVVEKTTRNSSRANYHQSQKSIPVSTSSTATVVSASSSINNSTTLNATITTAAPGAKNIKQSSSTGSIVSQSNNTTTTTTATTTTIPTTLTNSINTNNTLVNSSQANSITTQMSSITSHTTRGVSHSAAANTTASSGTNHNNNNNNNNSSPVDEKIGTRRSVRASAAANKIIYSRTNSAAATTHPTEGKASPAAKGGHSSESTGEVRRKTRSAVIGEALLTEGRRRRSSRDYK